MSKKVPLGVLLAVVFIVIAVTVPITVSVYSKIFNGMIHDLPERIRIYSGLSDIDELVRNNHYGTVDSSALDSGIAKGYLEGLGDEFSFYLTKDEYEAYYQTVLGNLSGTGLQASFDSEQKLLLVSTVAQGSPAENAGIQTGDVILSVNKSRVTSENYIALLKLLQGDNGKAVDLELKRPKTETEAEKTFSAQLTFGYKAQSCTYGKSGTIGYVRFTSFYENTCEVFEQALEYFQNEGVTGLVIDVRNNAGNNLDFAIPVIDRLVPMATEGTMAIATTKNSKNETVDTYSSDTKRVSLPMAVLINDRTQGAAELLACDLRDFNMAKLFGETTAGHGTVQKVFRLQDESAVILTVAKVYPYISDCYDGIGVAPNETVLMSEADKINLDNGTLEKDDQLAAALQYLS